MLCFYSTITSIINGPGPTSSKVETKPLTTTPPPPQVSAPTTPKTNSAPVIDHCTPAATTEVRPSSSTTSSKKKRKRHEDDDDLMKELRQTDALLAETLNKREDANDIFGKFIAEEMRQVKDGWEKDCLKMNITKLIMEAKYGPPQPSAAECVGNSIAML